MIVDKYLLDKLLQQDESITLDFKREQYRFQNANDFQKGELLKDILAFANADRASDAFIVIGVEEERKGEKSKIIGVKEHLIESNIQEFVNNKTKRPIFFSYHTISTESTNIDIICIPIQQRPFFIKKDYGNLLANTVYIRRGSSTSIADPDEISRMAPLLNSELIAKRIKIYQEAYEFSIKLSKALGEESSDRIKVCQEVRRWFNKNNLCLNPDIRYDLEYVIHDVSIHHVRVQAYNSSQSKERYDEMVARFDNIMSLPKRIQTSLDSMTKL